MLDKLDELKNLQADDLHKPGWGADICTGFGTTIPASSPCELRGFDNA